MVRRHKQEHHLDGLIALVLFGVFAACVLSVLLTGANVYHRLTDRDQTSYAQRTGMQYVASRVRQAPAGDSIDVQRFDGVDALAISEEIDGEQYVTYIYSYDGWLRERFAGADGDFSPQDGEQVLEMEKLSLALADGLLTIETTNIDGGRMQLALALREGRQSYAE